MAKFSNAKTAITFASSSTINKALCLEKGLKISCGRGHQKGCKQWEVVQGGLSEIRHIRMPDVTGWIWLITLSESGEAVRLLGCILHIPRHLISSGCSFLHSLRVSRGCNCA